MLSRDLRARKGKERRGYSALPIRVAPALLSFDGGITWESHEFYFRGAQDRL